MRIRNTHYKKLRSVVNDIHLFTDPDECVAFLAEVQTEKAFIIVSGSLGEKIVPVLHPMKQVDAIYIFCGDKSRHKEWIRAWPKIKGIHTKIRHTCEDLPLAVRQCNRDSVAVSFAAVQDGSASAITLDELEPSFMYTQLLKNALLDLKHDPKSVQDLVRFCQDKYAGNAAELALISEFGRDYRPERAIWWYTCECFTYQMLNRALRLLEADIMVNMGFFLHDLHRQLQQLHAEQVSRYNGKPFVLYRGQGLPIADFEKVRRTEGGLMSFNCFLSTSEDKKVSLEFAQDALANNDKVGVLFTITVDPKVTSTSFAQIQQQSAIPTEAEILFSMHTVFRIGNIAEIEPSGRLFEVQLVLTTDDDKQLRILTQRFDEEVQGWNGWDRVGRLLIQVGSLAKAEELYTTLTSQSLNEAELASYNHQLGVIKDGQGEYNEALVFYEKSLEMGKKTLPANHPNLATSYGCLGDVYDHMGEYSKALSSYETALHMWKKTLPADHPSLATSFNNIGLVYTNMGEYSKALSSYETALDMQKKNSFPLIILIWPLPSTTSAVCMTTWESTRKRSPHTKQHCTCGRKLFPLIILIWPLPTTTSAVCMITWESTRKRSPRSKQHWTCERKTLPANHPHLATSFNNIGLVYTNIGEYSKALSSYETALDMQKKTLPANHPHLSMVQESIDAVKEKLSNK